MTTYRLTAVLEPGRHALLRLVARLHALGANVTALHLEESFLRVSVRTTAPAHRLEAALSRSLDVRAVTIAPESPQVTTYVVLRQELREVAGAGYQVRSA